MRSTTLCHAAVPGSDGPYSQLLDRMGDALTLFAQLRDQVGAHRCSPPASPSPIRDCGWPPDWLVARLWRELLDAGELEGLAGFLTMVGLSAPFVDSIGQADLDASIRMVAATIPPGTPEHLDQLVTPRHHRQLAEGITGSHYAEIATGHLPFVEQPEQWATLILDFLGGRATE